jgi:elongation factor Ts
MAEVTAALVKQLREQTGAGMMDCKNALKETEGELDSAVDWLRKKGLATAAKKAGRTAAEGLVGVVVEDGRGAIVEVNSETDFVARNDSFQAFVRTVAALAPDAGGDTEALKAAPYPDSGHSVGDELTQLVATLGENLNFRRAAALNVSPGTVASYVHNSAGPGLGKIGVLVALKSDGDAEKLAAFGKQIAMHVAAANPQALKREDLDSSELERERDVLREQAKATGKPDDIVEKMVEGRLRKHYEEVVLIEQVYVIDTDMTVGKAIDAAAEDIGATLEVTGYLRFALGEGVERAEDDFAGEVAALTGQGEKDGDQALPPAE